ncbi:MAG: glycoside hydrolase family 65 protein [Spirochaetaceae bacterium]|nr:MAG: glycoside hydrolase family 65 protein [Spirochaetaceae bacterium]
MQLENNLATDTTWEIFETSFIPEQHVTTGSNYMIGNGYLGYRGTFADDRAEDRVACVLTDTYDRADGTWTELVTAPNGLFTGITVDGNPRRWKSEPRRDYRRTLDFRYGIWSVRATWPEAGISLREERFASRGDLHVLASRTRITADRAVRLRIETGIDGAVWSLNGEHYREISLQPRDESGPPPVQLEARCLTREHRYEVVVREICLLERNGTACREEILREGEGIYRRYTLDLAAGEMISMTKYVSSWSTNDFRSTEPISSDASRGPWPHSGAVQEAAARSASQAAEKGWEGLQDEHRRIWDARWADLDIEIEGDDLAQTLLRYNMYHNVIATPVHTDHLPIGARGLSCQAYQGAAFWDQEIFNLPMFLFTDPGTARNILVYRYRTLDGARRKARDLGYKGAFYAWVSGDTGAEICPSYFFRDVISGRRIRNHFNDWQIHISPDIAYTIWKYVLVTEDRDYLRRYGAEIVFEVARFLLSRVHYRKDLDRWEIIRVLGPDEYHENVDNNFFTNYQARFTLRYAREVYQWLAQHAPADLQRLQRAIGLAEQEMKEWQDVADRIFVPAPDGETGLIEQFHGFFQLEDTRPEVIRERLVDPGEYWGWPNGIAVETQVSKQADVIQLFVLHPGAYELPVMKANWEYYEPRTQHGSSLSYAVYAIAAAWIGHGEDAYRYFIQSCTVDLYNRGKSISGGTFIGGIHTAACGVAWQIVVQGFLGMAISEEGFQFAPRLPENWSSVAVPLQRRGEKITVEARGGVFRVRADSANGATVSVRLGNVRREIAPGEEVILDPAREE